MSSLDLPAIVQVQEGDSLPSSLLAKAEKIRGHGGVNTLQEKISTVTDGSTRNKEIVDEVSYSV